MNKDNYKKAINQIHVKDELKTKTFEKIKEKDNKKILYMKYLTACAMIVVIFTATYIYTNKNTSQNTTPPSDTKIAKVENDLPRFENIEQLKAVLKKNNSSNTTKSSILEDAMSINQEEKSEDTVQKQNSTEQTEYSTTNVQVENVDEADIVKTDGNYIYYVSNRKVYIVEANTLTIISKIEIDEKNEKFYPSEIYINGNKLVILGNSYEYNENNTRNNNNQIIEDVSRINNYHMAKAIIYDISNKNEPKQFRIVSLDGSYMQSRMIDSNLYLISNKSVYYYDDMENNEILPIIKDTAMQEETKKIDCTEIAYFKNTENSNYIIVASLNINNNEEINTETFFGASNEVYASEKNLYITESAYDDGFIFKQTRNTIYKFNLNETQIKLQCKGEVKGDLNNQFSIDEYEGNLRIATTSYNDNDETSNQLYILDENLNQIGKIENLAKGEKIYSVRFIGKVGYIVTFKEIDPLFIIDLSNPTNPTVKGQLKIPGYSSYLHPYDETHIIGIGYNTKSNRNGGVVNTNMKMSMFDVSDLENPKEMFSTDIGYDYAYSEIENNHKILFYNKGKNLIGFPVTYREQRKSTYKNSLVIFKINLEKGFEKYGEIGQKTNYKTDINRAIYIENILYTLSNSNIISYDLSNMNKIKEIELD